VKLPSSAETVAFLKAETDSCLLAFSCGKDSVATWIILRDAGFCIHPFYRYLVPGLEFVEVAIDYYERRFQTPVIRVPHPSLYRLLRRAVFQPPDRMHVLSWFDIPALKYGQINKDLNFEIAGHDLWCAIGTRACDNLNRRMAFNKWGPIRQSKMEIYPIWDFTKLQVFETIKTAGVKLPIDYRLFGRSFDGLDFRFLYQIKLHFPRDYAKILEWFPLAELEVFRYEQFAR
jgi:hypothetical protein